MNRNDPVGKEFYVPLKNAEILSNWTFYVAAIFSVLILLLNKEKQPKAYEIAQATFVVSVICFFLSGLAIRLYFSPRAQFGRVSDFVSNAFSVRLMSSVSVGYYNTSGTDPFVRIGSSILENSFFTKSIARKMLKFERIQICTYTLIWLWALFYRATDMDLLAAVSQVLFSEQLFSRWIRTEWLRSKTEGLFNDIYTLFRTTPGSENKEFCARITEYLIRYEISKTQAGLSLSSRIFKGMNDELSAQWKVISSQIQIK